MCGGLPGIVLVALEIAFITGVEKDYPERIVTKIAMNKVQFDTGALLSPMSKQYASTTNFYRGLQAGA